MSHSYSDETELMRDMERDRIRLRECRRRAEEIVRDYGWNEADEDFEFQIEEEAKRQWSEEIERECELERRWMMNADKNE